MATVTYHGEFPEGQDTIVQHGYEFERGGKGVKVEEKDLLAKFAGNRFFKTEGADADEVKRGKDEAEAAELQTLKDWLNDHQVPFHHKAGLEKLRGMKADYEMQTQKAAEE